MMVAVPHHGLMGTRSRIGLRIAPDQIISVYCHYDGYPSYMVPEIIKYIRRHGVATFKEEIVRAQKEGGMRTFSQDGIETYNNSDDEGWDYTTRCESFNPKNTESMFDYCYLVGDTGEIEEFYDDEGLQDLAKIDKYIKGVG